MKLYKIWQRLGKQPLSITNHQDADVYVDGDQYFITNVKYDSGKCIGFDAVKKSCDNCVNNMDCPPPHTCDICLSLRTDDYYSMWEWNKKE